MAVRSPDPCILRRDNKSKNKNTYHIRYLRLEWRFLLLYYRLHAFVRRCAYERKKMATYFWLYRV